MDFDSEQTLLKWLGYCKVKEPVPLYVATAGPPVDDKRVDISDVFEPLAARIRSCTSCVVLPGPEYPRTEITRFGCQA